MSRLALESAVYAKLANGQVSQSVVRAQPALTWTDTSQVTTEAIPASGRTTFIAAACDGGGTIAIRIGDVPDRTLDCQQFSTAGPIDLTDAAHLNVHGGTGFEVVTTAGHPHYTAKAIALPTH